MSGITSTSLTPNNVIGSNQLPLRKKVTVVSGANLTAGTIMGIVTDSGKYKAAVSGAGDGSETAVGVLLEDAAALSADVEAVVGFVGCYVDAQTTGLTDAYRTSLMAVGIIFE
jgi:hypothetical protein